MRRTRPASDALMTDRGFSLVEVLIAAVLLTTALVALIQLFVQATRTGVVTRHATVATVLAEQKLEELRGGSLSASPPGVLLASTAGYTDHIDQSGRDVGTGATPPGSAVYTRRWSIDPLPQGGAFVVQVSVMRAAADVAGRSGDARLAEEVRLVTVIPGRGR